PFLLHEGAHLVAADVGELHVEQDDGRPHLLDQAQGLVALRGVDHGKSALLEVAALDVARGVLVVDVEDDDADLLAHDEPRVASRRKSETFSREIMFLAIRRVPGGSLARNSAFTVMEVDTMTGTMLVLWSAASSWRTVKPSVDGI